MQFRFSLSKTTQINKYNNWHRWTGGGRKRKNEIERENEKERNNESQRGKMEESDSDRERKIIGNVKE